jgi:diguanylate cyclase (GGDEF)-like protein
MSAPSQTFPVLTFLGVVVQLGGALMLLGLFVMLRRFVLRRGYFGAWATAWGALAAAILALVIRYILMPQAVGTTLDETHPIVRALYFVYQLSKGIGFIYFLRGTLMYVAGSASGIIATRRLWMLALIFAFVSTFVSRQGLNEMVVWQSAIAVPALGYCASALLWLPRPRRTAGSVAAGTCFACLAALWLVYAVIFSVAIGAISGGLGAVASTVVSLNSYFDLTGNVLLGYAMILVLMEDAKREADDAQAELQVTHDRLRRAALYDSLTDSLNRRAYAEGVGLEMVKATFGTVVIADLDTLKFVNDRYGHAAGDRLLRQCADVLRATLRRYDKLYRWGGDEFLLIVPSARANEVLKRLQAALAAAEPIEAAPDALVSLAVSLGAADYASSVELPSAIERADRAMYAEKNRRKAELRAETGELLFSPPTSIPVIR